MRIIRATLEHLPELVILFNDYRQFYQQPSNLEGAHDFLLNNIKNDQSIVYIAFDDNQIPIGFVQLYPSWESVSMTKRWVLYDLFVAEAGRKKGVATALMNQAKALALDTQAKYIMLETALDNTNAQALYESLGYKQDIEFLTYILELDD